MPAERLDVARVLEAFRKFTREFFIIALREFFIVDNSLKMVQHFVFIMFF